MEPSCTRAGEDPGRGIRERGRDMSSHLHMLCHPRDTLSLQKDPVGHSRPPLCDLHHQHRVLQAPNPQISESAALFREPKGCTRLIPAPPNCRLPRFACSPPGWWAGSAAIPGQAEAGEQMSGDNEALTSPNPLPGLEAARGKGRKGSESP